ncbi:ArnT family glycosyltransferase [Curtobacterium herbarum]|uniref:Glycosyltransferase RgtA/B/C/D-like domain-containing protein n=1 Tax=Curtobacterium herbarum TaxID=150122 RepID=A0ABN1ZDX4_9MICO|nr:glycosyltransferase family 39 protein [Curtobacterium herbarum]MBM7477014.1 4-amino-4-deoxy-L-arabinose transferase-like glycosyltransferase [Curtobacterium herbarum]MCS6544976.1 glycosyltransferase family 39 protein [Curtobacterium herbarum]
MTRPARWRDEHPGARWTLVGILVGAAVLFSWNLARGGDFTFYQAAARSMSESWAALASGAFDPGATVTLDKLSGFAVPQALSLRLLGDSTAALAFPQVVEGLVTIWACSLVGLRWAGPGTGLVAAAAAATTPVFVSMFAHPMEDAMVTAALAVALCCWQRSVLTGTWWPLVAAGLAVGVGFQAKMLQAWLVLPALLLGTWLGTAHGRRLVRTSVLAAVAVVSSLSWTVALALVPAGQRPWIDGSTDNDPFAMVFGYNGSGRFLPGLFPGAVPAEHGTSPWIHRIAGAGDGTGLTKLVDPQYATQVEWLLPAAVLGAVLALLSLRARTGPDGARQDDRARQATRATRATAVTLLVWTGTAAAVLSAVHIPHTAYVAALGVQLCLLAASGWRGAVVLLRASRPVPRYTLAVLLLVETVWWRWLDRTGGTPEVLARPAVLVGLAAAAVALVLAAVPRGHWSTRRAGADDRSGRRRLRGLVAVATAAALLAGPAAFSLQALDAKRDGSGEDASVGTVDSLAARGAHGDREVFHVSSPAFTGGTTSTASDIRVLVRTALGLGGGRDGRPLFLSDSWRVSAPVIASTGRAVLTDGGYSGRVPVFTVGQVRAQVRSGVRLLVERASASSHDPVRQYVAHDPCRSVRRFVPGVRPGSSDQSRLRSGRHTGPADREARHPSGASAHDRPTGWTLWQCR